MKFYGIKKIRAQNGDNIGRIDLYGEISSLEFWGDEVTPSGFLADLNALGSVAEIECHIFSNGGDMFASLAIYSILRNRPETVKVFIDGVAASGGSIIACAGDVVYMPPEAMMFVHNLITDARSVNEHKVRELLAEMIKLKEPMINAYMQKSGKSREEIIALMDGETGGGTWLTADDAIEFGLADEYTPEAMQPLEAAACISPAVFSYRGYKIDLTGFDKAAEKTAGIINSNRGGNPMGGFFNRKKKQATKVKPKAEITFVEMVCPSCNGAVNLNPETGEIFAGGAAQQEGPEGPEGADNTPAAVLARKIPGNVRASIYSVKCPHCGGDFVWDTDVNSDGSDGQTVTKAVPIGGTSPAPAPDGTQSAPEPAAEAAQAVCPNCGAQVDYDTETAQTGTDDATGEEGYVLTCPECNTQFLEPLPAAAPDAVPAGASAEVQAAFRAGILAERNRHAALDEMAQSAPALAGMIQAAKKSGASAEVMSRNVIKAMAAGKGGNAGAAQFAAAIGRDIKASGVNNLRNPQYATAPKSVKASAYEKRIEEYNKLRGGRDDA
jgi:ATP-dependent Clp protease protease subunit